MVLWVCKEAGDLEEYQDLRKESRRLEKEYIETRVLLVDAKAALRTDPENEEFKVMVERFRNRLEELEVMAPRFSSEVPLGLILRSHYKMV